MNKLNVLKKLGIRFLYLLAGIATALVLFLIVSFVAGIIYSLGMGLAYLANHLSWYVFSAPFILYGFWWLCRGLIAFGQIGVRVFQDIIVLWRKRNAQN